MAEPQTLFSPGLQDEIRRYLLGKWQGDSAAFQAQFGTPVTLKETLKIVQERFPHERRAVLNMILTPMRREDPLAYERELVKKQAMRDFDLGYGWDLAPGVPGVCSLDDYNAYEPNLRKAKRAVIAWLERKGPGLLTLAGPPGVGKSHLADAAGSYLLQHNEVVVLRPLRDLMAELHKAVERRKVEEMLKAYGSVPWLILDDLGVATSTEWALDLLDQLIDARWVGAQGDLRTMVTTNLKAADLRPRLASRLGDKRLGVVVAIAAPDYRTKGA